MSYGFLADFVEESCTGTGDTISLTGATSGNRTYASAFSDGQLCGYIIKDSGGTIKVSGIGTYNTTGDTITRNDISTWNGVVATEYPSTNLTLSGGTHTISCNVTNQILIGMSGGGIRPYPSTKTFPANMDCHSGAQNATMVPNRQQFASHWYDHAFTTTGVSVRVSTVNTGDTTGYLGVTRLSDDCTHSDYFISGTVDMSTTGVKTVAWSGIITPGWYGMHFLSPSNHTMEGASGTGGYTRTLTNKCNDFVNRNSKGHVQHKDNVIGGLDADPNSITSPNYNNNYVPVFWFET